MTWECPPGALPCVSFALNGEPIPQGRKQLMPGVYYLACALGTTVGNSLRIDDVSTASDYMSCSIPWRRACAAALLKASNLEAALEDAQSNLASLRKECQDATNEAATREAALKGALKEARETSEHDRNALHAAEAQSRRQRADVSVLSSLALESIVALERELTDSLGRVQTALGERLSEATMCQICCAQPKDRVIVPCGHQLCSTCVAKVSSCPTCRGPIEVCVQTYG